MKNRLRGVRNGGRELFDECFLGGVEDFGGFVLKILRGEFQILHACLQSRERLLHQVRCENRCLKGACRFAAYFLECRDCSFQHRTVLRRSLRYGIAQQLLAVPLVSRGVLLLHRHKGIKVG